MHSPPLIIWCKIRGNMKTRQWKMKWPVLDPHYHLSSAVSYEMWSFLMMRPSGHVPPYIPWLVLNCILHMLQGPLIYTLPSLCLKQEISDNQYNVHTINTQPWYLKITTQERAHEKCRSWLWKFHLTRTEKWNKSKIAKFKQENKSHGS